MIVVPLWTPNPEPPSPAQLTIMRRIAATLLIVGGCTSATGVFITQRTHAAQVAEAGMSAVLVALGLIVLLAPAHRRLIEAAMLSSIVILSASMALLDPIGMLPFFFLWPIVYAAYFCSTRMLVAAFALMVVGVGAGVSASPHIATKLDTFEGTVVSVGLMGALVALMQHRTRVLTRELEHAARTDPLTGLLNRRVFAPALAEQIAAATSSQSMLSLVMFDLDHFKRFNDRHGHLAGDLALQRAAAALSAEAGPGDLVARLGGEEFAVLMPNADERVAIDYAHGVARRLADVESGVSGLTVSAGVCDLQRIADPTVDALLVGADAALYAAKAAGRSRAARWTAAGVVVEGDDAAQASAWGPIMSVVRIAS